MVTVVLLNVAWTCATPARSVRFSFFLKVLRLTFFSSLGSFFAIRSLPRLLHRSLARALAGPGVGMGPLAADRKPAGMPKPPIAADIHQPLDVHRDLLAQISLDAAPGIDDLAALADLLLGQVLDPDVGVDSGLSQDRVGAVTPDPVDVGEADLDSFLSR